MSISQQPLVSVIIPTYKRASYLGRAIDSVLAQTYDNLEVLVIDDNGLDTPDGKAVEQFLSAYRADARVRYVQHETNQHGGAARNTGIKQARGQYITFLDDDDVYHKDKVAKQVAYLQAHSEYQAVYCGWNRGKSESYGLTGDLSYQLLSGDQIILTNTIMMEREVALSCGGFDERLRRHQEAVFLLRYFFKGGKIGAVPEVLVDYDMSDRQNQEKNAKQVEEYTDYYLEVSQPFIERVISQNPVLEKKIYVHRWRGNLLNYLANREIKGAASFYIRKGLRYPLYFHVACLEYMWKRLSQKQDD